MPAKQKTLTAAASGSNAVARRLSPSFGDIDHGIGASVASSSTDLRSARDRQALFVQVLNRVVAVHASMDALWNAAHPNVEITAGHRTILRALLEQGPRTVAHLATVRQVSRQYVQVVVNQLVLRKLAEFVENPFHKRSPLVRSTKRGAETFHEILKSEEPIGRKMMGDADLATLKTVYAFLGSVEQRIDALYNEAKQRKVRRRKDGP